LVFENEIFSMIKIGDFIKGYVKKIREDNKLDISLQPIGYKKFIDVNSSTVYRTLIENNGYLSVTDKSSPEEIKSLFGLSKKAFKKSIGALYKQKKIAIEEGGIKILN
jgi:predicted RNA-binding protein (virulence factor B family)